MIAKLKGEEEIVVLTMYRSQADAFKKLLPSVDVETVDRFQGAERGIVLLSTVRSNDEEKLGHTDDERRVNVALSRCKRGMIILADLTLLKSDLRVWAKLVQKAERMKLVIDMYAYYCEARDCKKHGFHVYILLGDCTRWERPAPSAQSQHIYVQISSLQIYGRKLS